MGERITIEAPDGDAEAYLTGDPGRPGVLFYVDAIGLRPQIETMADRIASWGYRVLAPHLFYRDGGAAELAPDGPLDSAEKRESFMAAAMGRVRGYTPAQSAADSAAWVEELLADGATLPIGVTGYCMGARLATLVAGLRPDVVAAVGGFHCGRLVTDTEDSPHRALAASDAEFVYLHADNDASMPPEQVAALTAELEAAGLAFTNLVAEGASHGYSMADTAVYDEAATERHFALLQDVFARRLG